MIIPYRSAKKGPRIGITDVRCDNVLFSSTEFIYLFLPVVLLFYYVFFRKSRMLQNIFLLVASLVFYAWGEPVFVLIMIASVIVNWALGLFVDKNREKPRAGKLLIALDVIFNLSILFVFKYLTFTGNMINGLFGLGLPIPEIALPIGISFFTFQAMSYVIDVYRNKGEVQKNILYVGLYISFFPQLIAGPIVRYETIARQIRDRKETLDDFFNGFARFVVGLSKKVLLANCFAILADTAFDTVRDGGSISVLFSWLGVIAYTMQIFFDFSGYSDMAIGLGRMFGFHFLENFDYPYISKSITEFWRRWHISLGTWFRDYLYIPLGGSRCGKGRNILNLFIVWFLTGLWHGANYTFIVWGLMFFVLLLAERATGINKKTGRVLDIFKWLYTILFVMIGWVFFRCESIGDAFVYLRSMIGLNGNAFIDGMFTGYFAQNVIMLLIGVVLCTPVFRWLKEKTRHSSAAGFVSAGVLCALFVLSVSDLVGSSYNPFIYFNF